MPTFSYTYSTADNFVRLTSSAVCRIVSFGDFDKFPGHVVLDAFNRKNDGSSGVSYRLIYAAAKEAIKLGHKEKPCAIPTVHGALHGALQKMGFVPVAGSWRYESTETALQPGKLTHTPPAPAVLPAKYKTPNVADYVHPNTGTLADSANRIMMGSGYSMVNAAGGGCCYLSTAACEGMGLADDCRELQTLRWYRDAVLLQTAQGRLDVAHYYATAPLYLAQIRQSAAAEQILRALYHDVICPTVAAIEAGDMAQAYQRYRQMVQDLAQDLACIAAD